MQGALFAESLTPSCITFIASDKFIITEKKRAIVYEIIDGIPQEIKRLETQSVIVAALPTSFRHRFGLIEESGRISMHAL